MRTVLIVGLSSLGEGLLKALGRKVRLYGVDRKAERVDRFSHEASAELGCFDAADSFALADFLRGVVCDVGIVAIGGDFLAAEQVAESLRGLRISHEKRQIKRVIVTANRPYRARILQELGHEVVRPMIDAADSLGAMVLHDTLASFVRLGTVDDPKAFFGVAEIEIDTAQRIDDLEDQVPGVRVLGVRRRDGRLLVPAPVQAEPGTRLLVAGSPELAHRTKELLLKRAASAT